MHPGKGRTRRDRALRSFVRHELQSGNAIAVDTEGSAYVTGYTMSTDFPTLNAFQDNFAAGGKDVFVTKLDPSGTSLVYSTYLGGNGSDIGEGIVINNEGNAYLTGETTSTDFPIKNAFQEMRAEWNDAFITKLNSVGNALFYSTYLGGNDWDAGKKIAFDTQGNIYITGETRSTDFPIANAYQDSPGGESDAFVTKLNPSGSTLLYSTYLGGNDSEYSYGIARLVGGKAH